MARHKANKKADFVKVVRIAVEYTLFLLTPLEFVKVLLYILL